MKEIRLISRKTYAYLNTTEAPMWEYGATDKWNQ